MKNLAILLVALFVFCPIYSQDKQPSSPIIFIYDASGSMWGTLQGKTKMEIASSVLSTSIGELPQDQKIGLIAYGHRKKGDCNDVETLVSMDNSSKERVTSEIKKIKPLGKTPLARSARMVIDDLRKSKSQATIILITDGIESCDGDICEVVSEAKKEGISFKLHIVGFGLKEGETKQLKCAAKAGDGNYYDAADAGGLGDVLNEVTQQTIDTPEGNVSVFAVKNGIAIDAWVRAYDVVAKRKPISVRTYKDTAYFYLPPSTYNLEVNPLEGSDVKMLTVEGVTSLDDEIVHRTISFDGGKIGVATTNNGDHWDCIVKVLDPEGKEVAYVRTYQTPKEVEVNPGNYTLKIQALGDMKGLETNTETEAITVTAGDISKISHDFSSGKAFIDAKADGKSIDSVVTIDEANSGTNVAGGRTYSRGKEFLLNPGTYKVKVAPLGDYKARKAQTFTMEVKKGGMTSKTLNF